MVDKIEQNQNELTIIARSLAYLCLSSNDLKDANLGQKAALLHGLGLANSEIATMLGTSEASIRATLHIAMKKKKKKKKASTKKG